ncbi:MAG: flagellar protein FlaG [Gallionellaceae bacterium]|jgi:flagellar protein FlaG
MTISFIATRSVAAAQSDSIRFVVQAPTAPPSSVSQRSTPTESEDVTQAPSPERVEQAIKQVNETFTQKGQNLYASIERDKSTGIPVVKVLDKATNEVISQFPSKEIIAIAEAIDQSQEDKGQLINVSA